MTTTVLERPINKKVIEELDLPTEWYGEEVEMSLLKMKNSKEWLCERLEDIEDLLMAQKARESGSKSYDLEEVANEFGIQL
jgi:hypothetical protein